MAPSLGFRLDQVLEFLLCLLNRSGYLRMTVVSSVPVGFSDRFNPQNPTKNSMTVLVNRLRTGCLTGLGSYYRFSLSGLENEPTSHSMSPQNYGAADKMW